MKNFLFLFIFACSFSSLWAQTGQISGRVTDSSNKPIPYATVMLSGTDYGTNTADDGMYTIENITPGRYTVVFSTVGYGTIKKNIVVTANKTSIVRVSLKQQQQQLDEVVIEGHHNKYIINTPPSPLRLKTEIVKLPQNIQVIGSELLKDQQVTNMMEGVTRNVSGVTMIEHWGNFARVNMRGFRLPPFRNGVNFLDSWGPLSEDMAFVESIEIIKGPAGFMVSAGEPGGFYNVTTKKPTENFIADLNIMGGSFDFYRGSLDVGGKITENGKLLGRFNAMYQSANNHRNDGDEVRYGFAQALTYKFSDRTELTAELNYQSAESFMGAAYVFAPVSLGYGGLDRNFKFTDTNYPASQIEEISSFINFKHRFTDKWGVEAQGAYLRYDQEGNSFWNWSITEAGDTDRRVTQWDALSVGKYAQAYLYGDFNTASVNHKILAGFDFAEKNYWADFFNTVAIDTTPFNIFNPVYGNSQPLNFDRSVPVQNRRGGNPYSGFTNRSFYAQDEIGLLENKVRLTLAGRYTILSTLNFADSDKKFTPRFGLSIDVMPTLTVYGLYDKSFIAQSGVGTTDPTSPTPDNSFAIRTPQEASDIEGGIKKSFFDNRLRATFGAFLITKKNLLQGIPGFFGVSYLQDEVQSKGLEFDLQGEITPELSIILNYANTNVEVTEDNLVSANVGNRIAGHAKHVTNGWFNYNFNDASLFKGFGAALGYQYQIDRSTWAWGAENQSDLPDYFRLDGALSWKSKHIRVQLNVNNLLDEYLYSGANYGSYLYWQSEPGINGRLGVTYTF